MEGEIKRCCPCIYKEQFYLYISGGSFVSVCVFWMTEALNVSYFASRKTEKMERWVAEPRNWNDLDLIPVTHCLCDF